MSSVQTDKSSIGDRLRKLRKEEGLNQTDMGRKVGRSQQTWGAYESGDSTPPLSILQELLVQFDVDAEWLLTGTGDMAKKPTVSDRGKPYIYEDIPDDFEPKKVTYVPVYGAPLGAGQAGNAAIRKVRGYMAWEKRWLRREARISPDKAFVAQVYGQSMKDLIDNGDLVLGEMQEVVDHDGIYAARLDDELFIKHVMRRNGSIVLVSENDMYDRIEVGEYDDFSVIGRVVARVGSL